jgi:hypothetical protein
MVRVFGFLLTLKLLMVTGDGMIDYNEFVTMMMAKVCSYWIVNPSITNQQ